MPKCKDFMEDLDRVQLKYPGSLAHALTYMMGFRSDLTLRQGSKLPAVSVVQTLAPPCSQCRECQSDIASLKFNQFDSSKQSSAHLLTDSDTNCRSISPVAQLLVATNSVYRELWKQSNPNAEKNEHLCVGNTHSKTNRGQHWAKFLALTGVGKTVSCTPLVKQLTTSGILMKYLATP